MIGTLSRAFFHGLARSQILKHAASRYGLHRPTSFGRRFIAGETVGEAIAAVKDIESRGMLHTLDYLGEGVTTFSEADRATRTYLEILEQVVAAGIGRNISLKLSQLGLDVDRATCVDNLRRILDATTRDGFFVRIDMEGSVHTDVTLDVFETMWQQGYRNVGIVLQAYLHRTEADLHRVNRLNARIRLVKGAYREPKSVAFQSKPDVDAAFLRLMRKLLTEGKYPAIATHDPVLIAATRSFSEEHAIPRDRYEFQMLFGVRRDLQLSLSRQGHPFRVYVPFGREWFPYFMRRLGERPANLWFVLRSVLLERAAG